jgi:hypothetical protein
LKTVFEGVSVILADWVVHGFRDLLELLELLELLDDIVDVVVPV